MHHITLYYLGVHILELSSCTKWGVATRVGPMDGLFNFWSGICKRAERKHSQCHCDPNWVFAGLSGVPIHFLESFSRTFSSYYSMADAHTLNFHDKKIVHWFSRFFRTCGNPDFGSSLKKVVQKKDTTVCICTFFPFPHIYLVFMPSEQMRRFLHHHLTQYYVSFITKICQKITTILLGLHQHLFLEATMFQNCVVKGETNNLCPEWLIPPRAITLYLIN